MSTIEETPTAKHVGQSIRRKEDPRLLTGTARYTDDIVLPDMVHAAMLRSPHAHARIARIDTSGAKAAPGPVGSGTPAGCATALSSMPIAELIASWN